MPEHQRATAGTEAALRGLVAGLASGSPDYDKLSPQFAEIVRRDLPMTQPLFRSMGELKSVNFNGRIKVDQMRFQRILTNLVRNAREAMPHGGELFIDLEFHTLVRDHAAPEPNSDCSLLVPSAWSGERPANSSAGIMISPPPPAIASMKPVRTATAVSSG